MKKKVYQLTFPHWDKVKKRGSIINEVKVKNHGKSRLGSNNFDFSRSLRGIGKSNSKHRKLCDNTMDC